MKKSNVIQMPTLEDHLEECETRYQEVVGKLDSLDKRMMKIEDVLIDIKKLLKSVDDKTPKRYS